MPIGRRGLLGFTKCEFEIDMIADAEKLVRQTIAAWRPQGCVRAISPLTPDASLRRYFRVHFAPDNSGPDSVVAMVFDSVRSPEAGGEQHVTSDEAYVELSKFFVRNSISVPSLLFDARPDSLLLIEDCGDTLLAHALLGSAKDRFNPDTVHKLFCDAIGQIVRIQQIPRDRNLFAFKRSFQEGTYVREMEEIRDFSIPTGLLSETTKRVLQSAFAHIARTLAQMPMVLCHRDYHPWNIMVVGAGVRVIDFQDALLATRCYDIAALLNDRDTDAALGVERYEKLITEWSNLLGESVESIKEEFALVLLQRDLKVAGRFSKLVKVRNLNHYGAWIPGTQARIARGVRFLLQSDARFKFLGDFLPVLEDSLPAIAKEKRALFEGV